MKKALAFLMTLSVLGLLAACGGDSDNNTTQDVHEVAGDTTTTDTTVTDTPKTDTADTTGTDTPKTDTTVQDTTTDKLNCDDYMTCMNDNCSDAADANELTTCLAENCDPNAEDGVPDAVMGLIVCFQGACADDSTYACIFANCAADYFFCYHGTANATCADTLTCMNDCEGEGCGATCIDESTVAAGTDLGAYWTCQDTECPSEEGTVASDTTPCVYDADGYYVNVGKCAACLRDANTGDCETAATACGETEVDFGTATCEATVTCLTEATTDAAYSTCMNSASKDAYEVSLNLYYCVADMLDAGTICATECTAADPENPTEAEITACNDCFNAALVTAPAGCVGCDVEPTPDTAE